MRAGINDKRGLLLTKSTEVRSKWKEYTEELYCKGEKPKAGDIFLEDEEDVDIDRRGLTIMKSEIAEAIREMKKGKAVGGDGIPAEFIKILGKDISDELEQLCERIYETGIWPDDFTQTTMVPLPKKGMLQSALITEL